MTTAALRAGRAEAERLGYPLIDDRVFLAYQRALPTRACDMHPVRCPAELKSLFLPAEHHPVHRCVHPARLPEGLLFRVVHLCECGTEWTERDTAVTS